MTKAHNRSAVTINNTFLGVSNKILFEQLETRAPCTDTVIPYSMTQQQKNSMYFVPQFAPIT